MSKHRNTAGIPPKLELDIKVTAEKITKEQKAVLEKLND